MSEGLLHSYKNGFFKKGFVYNKEQIYICAVYCVHGSHMTWNTWKNESIPGNPGILSNLIKIMEK